MKKHYVAILLALASLEVSTKEYKVPDVGTEWQWSMVRTHTESGEVHTSPGHRVRAERVEHGVTVFSARLGGRSLELRQHLDGIAIVETDCNDRYVPLPAVQEPNHCGWNPCTVEVGNTVEWPLYVFRRDRSCEQELGVAKWTGLSRERVTVHSGLFETVYAEADITIPGLGSGGWNPRIRPGYGEIYATSGTEQSIYARIHVRHRTVDYYERAQSRELFGILARESSATIPCLKNAKEYLVVAFGDSLTAGGDGSYLEELERHYAWEGTRFCNAGVPGDTSEKLLKRIDGVLAGRPDLVLLAIGGNDMFRGVPRVTFEARLKEIILRLRRGGSEVVLLGLEVDEWFPYAGLYTKIARELRIPLIPNMLQGVYKTPGMLLDDGIHPNKGGNRKIAGTIAQHLLFGLEAFY